MQVDPNCIRRIANWTSMKAYHKFDKETFDEEKVADDLPKYSPKLFELVKKIRQLDEKDQREYGKTFKHFIFSDVKIQGAGAKVTTSALIASGFHLAYEDSMKLRSDQHLLKTKSQNIVLLSSTAVFNKTINARFKKEILSKFNQRPDNVHGELIRIIIADGGFKEGVDMFDVKYTHILEPQISKADLRQAIGRTTRLCGQKGLEFHPSKGWPLNVFLYDVDLPEDLLEQYGESTLFDMYLKYKNIDLRKLKLVDALEVATIHGSVDYELNKNVHRFEIKDDEGYDLSWLFPSRGGAPVFECQGKCGSRPTKKVPLGTPVLALVYFSLNDKMSKYKKPRLFFCDLLKKDEAYCERAREAWNDLNGFVRKYSSQIQKSVETREYLKMPSYNRETYLRIIKYIRPSILKKARRAQEPQTSPDKPKSPELTDLPKIPKPSQDPQQDSEEQEQQDTPSPPKTLGFIEVRNHVRENFSEYTWPKVQLENMCVPKGGDTSIVRFTPTQDFMRNYFTPASPQKGMLLCHSVGTGKCHAKDTPILMYDGNIRLVQDIKVGDFLMGDDSTPRKVLSLARGDDEMYDIIPVKGDKYTVNKEHILVLKYSGRGTITNLTKRQPNLPFKASHIDKKTLTMKSKSFASREEAEQYLQTFTEEDKIIEIEVQKYIQLAKSTQRELKGFRKSVEFKSNKVDFDPYIIGVWLGDGTKRDPKITNQDARILQYIRKEVVKYDLMLNYEAQYDYRISPITPGTKNKFLEVLQKHNLINNKHIPLIYKCNDREIRLKVLAGLLDTDGSYSAKDKCFEISQKLDVLANDIVYLARSLGFAAYSKKKKGTWTYKGVKKSGLYNRIHISGDGLENIPTLIHRKHALKRNQIKDVLTTGIQVKHVGKDEYYGFTLDGNNRYLLGDFTVTHNTCCAIATATSSFEKEGYTILWVTRSSLKSDIWKNMYDQVCSIVIQDRLKNGFKMPEKMSDRMRLLSKTWSIRPMSYKQFSNLISGKNKFYEDLVKKNGKEDPLKKTLLIIDEAHKLYGGADLSSSEKPDMNKLHKALMDSYKISGQDSVKLLMMTGTPITNDPMEMVKLINLCKEKNAQMEDDFDKFYHIYLDTDGKFTKKGKWRYLNEIAGYISYLSRERDARQFAQPIIQNVRVDMSTNDNGSIQEIEKKYSDEIDNLMIQKDGHLEKVKSLKSMLRESKGKKQKNNTTETQVLSLEKNIRQHEEELEETNEKIKEVKIEMRQEKSQAKLDPSQQGTFYKKCIKSSRKTSKKLSNSNSNSEDM